MNIFFVQNLVMCKKYFLPISHKDQYETDNQGKRGIHLT